MNYNKELNLLSLYMYLYINDGIKKNVSFDEFKYYLNYYGYYVELQRTKDSHFNSYDEKTFKSSYLNHNLKFLRFLPKYTNNQSYINIYKKLLKQIL